MKGLIVITFIVVGGALYAADDASAQRSRVPKPPKFAKFTHQSHVGQVKSLINNQTIALDCAYCHGTAVKDKLGKDQHDLAIAAAYPSRLNGAASEQTHSSCTECHSFSGAQMPREMCAVCHDKLTPNPQQMATNLRRFPNPDGGGKSQFYDYFSHADHVDYFEQYATASVLKNRLKFFDAKATDAKLNKGLDKNKFECAACHTTNAAPVTVAKINFKDSARKAWRCRRRATSERKLRRKPDKPRLTGSGNDLGNRRQYDLTEGEFMLTIELPVDEALLAEIDRTSQSLEITRTEFVRQALEMALHKYEIKRLEQQHEEGYRRFPVAPDEFEVAESELAWGPQ